MKTFTCTEFTGFNPVGAAAIVTARDAVEAAERLNTELRAQGLEGDAAPEDMTEFPANPAENVRVLVDGEY